MRIHQKISSVKYDDFNQAIQLCLRAGIGCKIGKSDMKAAYRNLGLKRRCWPYLVMKAKNPLDNTTYYFVDKCLCFGAAISCTIFQTFLDSIAHIVKFKTSKLPRRLSLRGIDRGYV